MIDLRFSPLESARFALRVCRAEIDDLDVECLADAIESARCDVAIVRIPEHSIEALSGLLRRGLTPIVADTLVRYAVDLNAAPQSPVLRSVRLRPTEAGDASRLAALAREIFEGYVSHYHANPRFAATRILDGYAEWAASHAHPGGSAMTWLVEDDRGDVVGFSCCRIDTDGSAVGVLNGIRPAARQRGLYRAMFRAMLGEFRNLGIPRFKIATQAHNDIVQRVWIEERLTLQGRVRTVHVNA